MTDNTQGLDDILDTLAEKSADSDSRLGYVDAYVFAQEAKQALTSLIKELVAEAKPEVYKLAPANYTENCTNVVMSLVDQYTQSKLKAFAEEVKQLIEKSKEDNLDYHGRPDCKNCSLIEDLEALKAIKGKYQS